MSGVKVLDFVAQELKGQVLTVSSLAAFVAAEKAADKLGMSKYSREAAELTVLLPKAPVERIRDEFGSATADIVKALRIRSSYSSIVLEAAKLYANSEGDTIRKDTVIAVCAAEAAIAPPGAREVIASLLDRLVQQEARGDHRKYLEDLRTPLFVARQVDEQGDCQHQSTVISISMDVCGSTEAKARMKACAREEKELVQWYEAFHRDFLNLEWDFYSALFGDACSEAKLDWKHAFVVKGIGDEIWLLYEVGAGDAWKLRSLMKSLLDAALNVAGRLIYWTSAREDENFVDGVRLPLKFYIDVLKDSFEISGPRRDFVTNRLPEFLGAEENWLSNDFIELGNRLHAGSFMGDSRYLVTSTRSDYIGWEVDRFFRATSFALPCVVTVGQELFENVFDISNETEGGIGGTELRKAVIPCPIYEGGGIRFDHRFRYVKKDICAAKLKGVGSDYTVYRVLREHDLLGLHHTDTDEKIMNETFEVFTPEMVKAMRETRRRERSDLGEAG